MNIEIENELLDQSRFWNNNEVPKDVVDYCCLSFPILTVRITDTLSVKRVKSFGMAIPYIENIRDLLNIVLPPAYPRFTIGSLVEQSRKSADGRVFDLTETWKGNTFLIEEEGKLIGVAIGRRERIFSTASADEL